MNNNWYFELLKVIGVAFLISMFIYGGSGNATPSIFLFYFIVFFYLATNYLREELNAGKKTWLILATAILAGAHLATGFTVSNIVNYCDGFFKDEMMCELKSQENLIYEKYRSNDYYPDREYGLW